MWTHLERQERGMVKGMGEKQIELDKHILRDRGRILQGKELAEFIGLFPNMFVLKGGLSAGYKKFIADKGINDDTYNGDCVALIEVSSIGPHNSKTVQVGTSLNSTSCFLLQSGSSFFTWHENASTSEQQQLAARIAEFLKPGVTLIWLIAC